MPRPREKAPNTDVWARLIGLAGVVTALGSAVYTCQYDRTVLQRHITPDVKCHFLQASVSPRKYGLVLENKSPIDLVSLSVDAKTFAFSKSEQKARFGFAGQVCDLRKVSPDVLPTNWFELDAFKRGQRVEVPDVPALANPSGYIEAFRYLVSYYRSSDLELFKKRCLFFADDGLRVSNKDFRKSEHYAAVLSEMKSWDADFSTAREFRPNIETQ